MDFNSPLFLLCSLAGVLLVVGSLYLLWKGVIDLKEGQSTEMNVSGVGTIKTPVPAIVMFALGVFLVAFPVYKSPHLCPNFKVHTNGPLEMVKLYGKAAADADVEVYAIVDAQPAHASDDFTLVVPYVHDRRYLITYRDKTDKSLLDDENFRLEPGKMEYRLRGVRANLKAGARKPPIPLTQVESKETAEAFK
ncbi:MAG: hypothetical protein ABW250_23530 [Pyrinomonadaceae bacterium]